MFVVRSPILCFIFFFSSRRRHTRCSRDWSSDVCSSDDSCVAGFAGGATRRRTGGGAGFQTHRRAGAGLSGCAARRASRAAVDSSCVPGDRKSTRLNSSHGYISYAVFCLKKKTTSVRTYVIAAISPANGAIRTTLYHPWRTYSVSNFGPHNLAYVLVDFTTRNPA